MKAHDVRYLTLCDHCKELGDSRHMIEHASPSGIISIFHGRCIPGGLPTLLSKSPALTLGLTLGDIGKEWMTALIDATETHEKSQSDRKVE